MTWQAFPILSLGIVDLFDHILLRVNPAGCLWPLVPSGPSPSRQVKWLFYYARPPLLYCTYQKIPSASVFDPRVRCEGDVVVLYQVLCRVESSESLVTRLRSTESLGSAANLDSIVSHFYT